MSTADVAVIAVTAFNLAVTYLNHKRDTNLVDKLADRLRIVNPQQPKGEPKVEAPKDPAADPDVTTPALERVV